jgi:hypothetical protein
MRRPTGLQDLGGRGERPEARGHSALDAGGGGGGGGGFPLLLDQAAHDLVLNRQVAATPMLSDVPGGQPSIGREACNRLGERRAADQERLDLASVLRAAGSTP